MSDQLLNDPTYVKLTKYDSELDEYYSPTSGNMPQGSASLENAKYEMSFYSGHYNTEQEAVLSGQFKRKWVYKTDVNGVSKFYNIADLVDGEPYRDSGGRITFPLGTYVIKEQTAPIGYQKSDKTYVVRVVQDGQSTRIDGDTNIIDPQTAQPFIRQAEEARETILN